MHNLLLRLAAPFLLALGLAAAKRCEGENLPPDAPLKIGVLSKSEDGDACLRAKNGDRCRVHYTVSLYSDCVVFDSSIERMETLDFEMGRGMVIKGWCVKRTLLLPLLLLGLVLVLFYANTVPLQLL